MEHEHKTQTNQTLLGILAYLGILVIIPYFIEKENAFVKFHVKQGVVLFILEMIIWIFSIIFPPLRMIVWLLQIFTLILTIIGIINVVNKKEQELPVIGRFAKNLNIK